MFRGSDRARCHHGGKGPKSQTEDGESEAQTSRTERPFFFEKNWLRSFGEMMVERDATRGNSERTKGINRLSSPLQIET